MHADERVGDAGQRLDVRTQCGRPKGAVQADEQRLGMADGLPEGFGRLARQRPPAQIRDRPGDHHRQPRAGLEYLVKSEERRLGIQRVEDRLDHDEIDAAVDQSFGGFAVGIDQFGETDVAGAGVVDVGRDACGSVRGAEHACDPAWLAGGRIGVRRLAGEFGGGQVDLAHGVFERVVGLGDARCRERIGLDHVRARLQVGAMRRGNHVGARQRQDIAIAFEVGVVALERLAPEIGLYQVVGLLHGACGAVEDEYAIL